MKDTRLAPDVLRALAEAARTPGWNNRSRDVKRFDLAHPFGLTPCTLYVVPVRRWAYRRRERQAEAWRSQQESA
jgi:hypothetical protein